VVEVQEFRIITGNTHQFIEGIPNTLKVEPVGLGNTRMLTDYALKIVRGHC
jgi:hypothetical protein